MAEVDVKRQTSEQQRNQVPLERSRQSGGIERRGGFPLSVFRSCRFL